MKLTTELAAFSANHASFPSEMRCSTLYSLFDWATVGVAGANEPVASLTREAILEEGGNGQATLIGGGSAPARAAALVNGATSHALDYDDTHFLHIGHPSVVVVPAALAVAERENALGTEFLDALAVGLELSCRIGDWLGREHYEAGFHQTGTAGAFGACAAAGRLMQLDQYQMAQALGLTATRASGLKCQFGTMGKPLNAGFAAEVGVTCATLVAKGIVSNPEAIEGAAGFGVTHAAKQCTSALQGLGEDWVFPNVSYKFHACCHGLHAMLESIQTLRADGLRAEAAKSITVSTHPRWLSVCNQLSPTTGLGAKFSYRLTAAMALAGVSTAALNNFSDDVTQRADLVALRDRVNVIADDSLTDMQALVVVETTNGETRTMFGDLAVAIEPATLKSRLLEKSSILLGANESELLWQASNTIDQDEGVAFFAKLLAG